MRIDILTLFPQMIDGVISQSIIKRAIEKDIVQIFVHDYREYSKDRNKKVDDYPYGGGAGMLIELDPIVSCLKDIPNYSQALKILTSAQGETFNQKKAYDLSKYDHLIIICGHYEGIDERIMNYVDMELSIGDFILTGGEIACLAMVDCVVRLLPNVLGNNESSQTESFNQSLLEYPQYTRPVEYDGYRVPDVLLSGHHEKIRVWRKTKAIENTIKKRPDLIDEGALDSEELEIYRGIKDGK